MRRAELREAMHRHTVFLVGPGELEPEIPLCERGCHVAACHEDPQRCIAMHTELVDARLQRAELLTSAARQNPQRLRGPLGGAHTRRNASNAAVVSSSSAMTSQ